MKSFKPFVFDSVYNWLLENENAPHVTFSVLTDGVVCPPGHDDEGVLTINLSPVAIGTLLSGEEGLTIQTAFGGKRTQVFVPWEAIICLYGKDTKNGLQSLPMADEQGNIVSSWVVVEEETVIKTPPVTKPTKPTLTLVK